MAATFDAKPTAYDSADGLNDETIGGTSATAASGMSIGASASILVAQMCFGKTGTGDPTNIAMTWDGVAMSSRVTQLSSDGAATATAHISTLDNPATGAKTLAATWTTALDCYMSCSSHNGASYGSSTSNTQSTSIAVPTTLDGMTVAVFASNGSTPTVNQNKIWAEAPNSPGGGGNYATGGSGTTSHTFTGAGGGRQAIAAVQLLASASSTGVPLIGQACL